MGRANEEKIRRKKIKEDPGLRKGRKVAKHCAFPMVCRSGGSKSRLAKAAGAEPTGQMKDEKLHAVVARRPGRIGRGVSRGIGTDIVMGYSRIERSLYI